MALTKIGSIGINTGIAFAGVTTIATLNGSDSVLSVGGTVNFVSDVSIGGTVSIAGTLTYEDVTNVDAVGLITARDGIKVGSGITLSPDGDIFFTGIMTGNGSGLTGVANTDVIFTDKLSIGDSPELLSVGVGSDLRLFHDSNRSAINNATGELRILSGSDVIIGKRSAADSSYSEQLAAFKVDGAVELYHDNSKKLETASGGVTVTGTLAATAVTGDGSGLTGIGGTDFIHSEQINNSGITTSQAFVPTTGQLSHRNIFINGDMTIAQRSTSESSSNGGYQTVDRFKYPYSNNSANLTQAQVDVASGTTPYTLGFRKSYKITNGNQTGGAGSGDRCRLQVNIEAQDIANSGWNYLSSSSFITLSFWVKSSVAQNFYGSIRTPDGTEYGYSFETGSLTADTWTKITKTIPGDSNLTFDNNAELGWNMDIAQFLGTDYTSSSNTMNQWAAYDGNARTPDNTGTWFTTNGATWEITGLQLEVGSVATDFEHRTFAQELLLCRRYCNVWKSKNANKDYIIPAKVTDGDDAYTVYENPVQFRSTPTIVISSADHIKVNYGSSQQNGPVNFSQRNFDNEYENRLFLNFDLNSNVLTSGDMVFLAFTDNTADGTGTFTLDAEL